jgi:hypothetical protein
MLLFELLAGHARLRRHELAKQLPKVRAEVRSAIERACDPDPDKRFKSALDFRAALPYSSATVLRRGVPAVAFCKNLRCRGTRWSREGRYVGRRVVPESTRNNCELCGKELVYDCRSCGSAYETAQYCGDCGQAHYYAPSCEKCNGVLTKTDTHANSTKCASCTKKESGWADSYIPSDPGDDDIPF